MKIYRSLFAAVVAVSATAVAETVTNIPLPQSAENVLTQALADPAAAHLARPTPGQIEWVDMEREMFVHFGVSTWKGQEYDSNGKMDLTKMNPSGFDAEQACAAAKSWGEKQVILVRKHVGGFCWWPTDTTDYCVRNIPWKGGKGIVFTLLTVAGIASAETPAPAAMPSYLKGYEALWARDHHLAAMEWFKQAKYGMFLCLSPASQVGQAGWQKADDDWTRQWHAKNSTLPQDKYDRYMADKFDGQLMSPAAEKLLHSFTAKNFDADKIADLAVAADMKYIIFTTHHVLGRMYLFRTETSPLNSIALAPKRDFVAELAKACQSRNLGLFLYVGPPYTTPVIRERYRTMLTELLTQYGPIAGIWFDGIGEAYRRPTAFDPSEVSRTYALVRKLQPQCLISFKSGYTGEEDYLAPEWHQCTYGPDGLPRIGKYGPDSVPDNIPADIFARWNKTLRYLFAETSTTMLYQKGYKSAELWFDQPGTGAEHKTVQDVLAQYQIVRKRNQNFALDIALRGDGSIHPADDRVLREVGQRLTTQRRADKPPTPDKEQEQHK